MCIRDSINALSTLIFLTVLLLLVIVNLPDFLDREKRDKKRRGMRTA